MKVVIIFIFFVFISLYSLYYLWFVTSSKSRYYDGDFVKETIFLTWKEIKSFHKVNPEKWSFRKTDICQDLKHLYYRRNKDFYIAIIVSPLNLLKIRFYNFFSFRSKDNKGKVIFLEDIQKDIDKIKEEANKQIKESYEFMKGKI